MRPRVLLTLLIVVTTSAHAQRIASREQVLADGSLVLQQETVVKAPLDAVWAAFTTKEGWESWAVPFAEVDLRLEHLHAVIEMESLSDGRTRVVISGVGYLPDSAHRTLLQQFEAGNRWTLERLLERFERGRVEWQQPPGDQNQPQSHP